MYVAIIALIGISASSVHAVDGARHVPSSPTTWPSDLVAHLEPVVSCPGGTAEGLRKRMGVSGPFNSPRDYKAAVNEELPPLNGLLPGDAFHWN